MCKPKDYANLRFGQFESQEVDEIEALQRAAMTIKAA